MSIMPPLPSTASPVAPPLSAPGRIRGAPRDSRFDLPTTPSHDDEHHRVLNSSHDSMREAAPLTAEEEQIEHLIRAVVEDSSALYRAPRHVRENKVATTGSRTASPISPAMPANFCFYSPTAHPQSIVMRCVEQNGHALVYAASRLQFDRDVVIAAVKQDGGALRYAADELQADTEIVKIAVAGEGVSVSLSVSCQPQTPLAAY